MTTATEKRDGRRMPTGVYGAEAHQATRVPIPDILVRWRSPGPDEVSLFRRPRFCPDIREVASVLGDLGTFLPHISGTVTVIGMGPTGVLTAFGLLYGFTGAFYGVPIAVRPRPCRPSSWGLLPAF